MGLMGFITLFCLSFIANYNSVKKGMQLILAKIFSCGKWNNAETKFNQYFRNRIFGKCHIKRVDLLLLHLIFNAFTISEIYVY